MRHQTKPENVWFRQSMDDRLGTWASAASLSGRNYVRGEANETGRAYHRGYGRRFGLRYNAQDSNMPRRIGDSDERALSAATAAAAAAATTPSADGELR